MRRWRCAGHEESKGAMKSGVIGKTEGTYAVDLMKAIHVELTYKTRELEEMREKGPRGGGRNSHCCA